MTNYDPTIAEILNRPWPAPVSAQDVLNAAEYQGVRVHDGRIPARDAFKVSYLVEHHARLVAQGTKRLAGKL